MDDPPQRLKQTCTVKSRYLNYVRKGGSSRSDNSGLPQLDLKAINQNAPSDQNKTRTQPFCMNSTLLGNGKKAFGSSTMLPHAPKPGGASKTSTPTKDISLFTADLSVVPSTECGVPKEKPENPAEIPDQVFSVYSTGLLLRAMDLLIEEQQSEWAKVADHQLATLQKAVDDSSCTLSDLNLKIDAGIALTELQEDVVLCEDVMKRLTDDPAFSDSAGFEHVRGELEGMLNHLPCKNVKIPNNQADIDEIENAATRLLADLSDVSLRHGEEIALVSNVHTEMSKIDSLCNNLTEVNSSMKELMPIATTKVLDETSRNMMSSAVANMDIKF